MPPTYKFERERNGIKVNRVHGVCWFTNIEHDRRHQPLSLMTESDNIKHSKHKEIKGLEWNRIYETYHNNGYNTDKVWERVIELLVDDFVTNGKGVFEYVLGGEKYKSLLNIRIFDDHTKKAVYQKQTNEAEKKGISNCPTCALCDDVNKRKIWKLSEMDADHVVAWAKGGLTNVSNCQILCKTHNRAKGNK